MSHPRGIAVAAACARCAAETGGTEHAPGRFMSVIGAAHLPGLAALGWEIIRHPHEPCDIICPHYRALCPDGAGA